MQVQCFSTKKGDMQMSLTESELQINGREYVWSRAVALETGISVSSCYQCLRCTNSCPVSSYMDIKPHQVVRLVQLGCRDALLESSTIWICLSCEMCSTYCPNEIHVARLMDYLKNSVVASRKVPAEYEIAAFHEVFLDVLTQHGRINDLQLMQRFKWKTLMHGNLPPKKEVMKDLSLAMALFKRRRLHLLPERSPAANEIRRIVAQHGRKGVPS